MIRTGQDLRAARVQLGWTTYEMGSHLRLSDDIAKGGQRVREMEDGAREVTGPISVAVEAFLAGYHTEPGWIRCSVPSGR
jgi:hypothetical protein